MLVGELWCRCLIKLEKEFGINNDDIRTAKSITEWRMLNDLTIGEIKLRDMTEWFIVYLPLQFDVTTQQEEIVDNMCRQFIHQVCNKLLHLNDHILKGVNKNLYRDILLVRTRSAELAMKYDDQTRIAYLERDKISSSAILRYHVTKHTNNELIIRKDSVTIFEGNISKDSRMINLSHPFGKNSKQDSHETDYSLWMNQINDQIDFYHTPYNISIREYLSSDLSPEYVGNNIFMTANSCSCVYVMLLGMWIPVARNWFESNWQSFPESVQSEYYMYKSIEGVA